ncbi:MAG: SUMF1/EgtB/PvdO family nonheme iron enzyme [Verrucomicrobiota bacterium]
MAFAPVAGTKVLFGIWDVRVQDYQQYAEANPGVDEAWRNPGFAQAGTHPVVNVSWADAKAFCAWLTKKEQGEGKLAAWQEYWLPTDAEWSYAVGIGDKEGNGTPKDKDMKLSDVYPWGTQWPPPKGAGNYSQSLEVDSYQYTASVGSFPANQYGLCDMGGNVWQWCEDWYDADQKFRVLRGGAWSGDDSLYLLSSYRVDRTPGYLDRDNGFRLVVASATQSTTIASLVVPTNVPQSSEPTTTQEVKSPPLSKVATATKEHPWTNSIGMPFVPVPGTKVLFGIWDVRVQDYAVFASATGQSWEKPSFPQGLDHPAVMVSWDDAKAFCAWLTKKEQGDGKLGAGQEYRLPTDAEWSYAVGIGDKEGNGTPSDKRGKLQGVYPWGTQWPPPKGVGNYAQSLQVDDFEYTSPVGSFGTNQFGLYDMGGNVWQWCEDWHDTDQKYRGLRGGSWDDYVSRFLLSSYRYDVTPDGRGSFSGFRVVVGP